MKTLFSYKNQNLNAFPEELRFQPQITNLNLSGNQIRKFPDWIGKLKSLKVLYLSDNKIEDLAPIGELPNLTVLYLNNNKIKRLPKEISALTSLKRLFLNVNQIVEIPHYINCLTSLEQLQLDHNRIETIHQNIGLLKQLEVLRMSSNSIRELPETISNLIKIKGLDISNNEIIELPENIGKMSHLEHLECYSNQIEELPESLCFLDSLKSLNIGNNRIRKVMHVSDSIEQLSIYNNPIDYLDPEIVEAIASKTDAHYNYIFLDEKQYSCLYLGELEINKGIKLVNLTDKNMSWQNRKHLPTSLQSKWQIEADRPGDFN